MNMKWSGFKVILLILFFNFQSLSAVNLAPHHVSLQSGGGMGVVSVGTGWCYGAKDRWETDIIAGLVPKYDSNSAKLVVALKENFAPWAIAINKHISLTPLTASLYFTTIVSKHFWASQPDRYPSGYYGLTTKIRANISFGERIEWCFPSSAHIRSAGVFYEIGTCDIYALSAFDNSALAVADWLQLCIGMLITF